MSPDPTEAIRRALLPAVNAGETDRASLEGQYGQVWNTEELKDDGTVTLTSAGYWAHGF